MIKEYIHINKGTCSSQIKILYDDVNLTIEDVKFTRGCPGNTKGIEILVKNRSIKEIKDLLKGTPCGNRGTSCPNELAIALEEILNNN